MSEQPKHSCSTCKNWQIKQNLASERRKVRNSPHDVNLTLYIVTIPCYKYPLTSCETFVEILANLHNWRIFTGVVRFYFNKDVVQTRRAKLLLEAGLGPRMRYFACSWDKADYQQTCIGCCSNSRPPAVALPIRRSNRPEQS